jgi:hypothetical protein
MRQLHRPASSPTRIGHQYQSIQLERPHPHLHDAVWRQATLLDVLLRHGVRVVNLVHAHRAMQRNERQEPGFTHPEAVLTLRSHSEICLETRSEAAWMAALVAGAKSNLIF